MTFTYDGREFEQLDEPYNATITNERAVEVPIALDFVKRYSGDGLEVGNVLAHYDYGCVPNRRIVDLYEEASYVDNLDVFAIDGHFDWIVSVSTIEHVRYPENPWAGVAALAYLRGLLRPGGHMLVTVGLGQNATLDDAFLAPEIFAAHYETMLIRQRGATPSDNEWVSGLPDPYPPPYGPTHGANAVWIGEWGPA